MSLGSKLKDFFTSGGCVLETKDITLDTVQDALDLINKIRTNRDLIGEGAPKVLAIVEQLVHWVEVIQKDMDLVKYDKLRTVLHAIAEIKIQLATMVKDIDLVRSMKQDELAASQSDCIAKIKETVKKIKKQKETKDDNK